VPRVGSQTPTYSWCSSYTRTEGRLASALADAYGLSPHQWQRTILDDWLALDDEGHLLNSMCVLPVPRQNGKTGVCDPRETWGLVHRGEWILHTAQEYQTAKKAFDRLRAKFGDRANDPLAKYPELNAMVSRYTTSANQMVLDLKNGAHIEFRTRGSNSDMGRGGTFDLVVIDEAQSYTEAQDAALSPLNSAAPHGSPQTILMGTVPDPTSAYKGEKFAAIRESLHDEPYVGGCIHEWAAPEVGDAHDVGRWYEFNPSLGYQLLESAMLKDSRTMTAETFAREHLGWWPSNVGKPRMAIDAGAWDACATDHPLNPERTCYGVKFAADGSEVMLAVAESRGDVTHVELQERRPMSSGTAWLADWLCERTNVGCCVVVDGRSGSQALVERMSDRAPRGFVVTPSSGDVIAAASMLCDAVSERRLTWYRPQEQLRESATTATRRAIGRGGGWGFGGADPLPIEACALALWGSRTTKRNPNRKARIG
jgi:hypothetical protein